MARRVRVIDEEKKLAIASDIEERQRALEFILRERRHLLADTLTAGDVCPDPLEVAQDLEEEQVCLAVLDQSRETQVQLDEAMHLLAEGRYGQCVDCGGSIPPARLRALPFALRCLACQERFETRRAHGRFSRILAGRYLVE